jgi:hypothetical protein
MEEREPAESEESVEELARRAKRDELIARVTRDDLDLLERLGDA